MYAKSCHNGRKPLQGVTKMHSIMAGAQSRRTLLEIRYPPYVAGAQSRTMWFGFRYGAGAQSRKIWLEFRYAPSGGRGPIKEDMA